VTDQQQIAQAAQLAPGINDDPIVSSTHRLATFARYVDPFVVEPAAFVAVSIHNSALHRPSEQVTPARRYSFGRFTPRGRLPRHRGCFGSSGRHYQSGSRRKA